MYLIRGLVIILFPLISLSSGPLYAQNNCLLCHKGIEEIRDPNSGMMRAIYRVASRAGYPDNSCIVCHGGNPNASKREEAHQGTIPQFRLGKGPKDFYPDPGSPWINRHSCGMCHEEKVKTQYTSLMFTEAGKIQGTMWGFGALEGYEHRIGNYEVQALQETLGTQRYRRYLEELKRLEPQVFPDRMEALPAAPTPEEVDQDPRLAVYTYIRQECQRCHTGNKGRKKRGDYRGMGCSACHLPYSNEGFYEGDDPTIPKDERGHPLVHILQGTREAKVKVHGLVYSGIPVETCTTCHNRGKRIGTSFQGLMETAYTSPWLEDGSDQPRLHSKHYLHLQGDIHREKGMLCQDCHTTLEIHGDGVLAGTTLAAVEIECQDCHGTPDRYPWELPLGFGDEIRGHPPARGRPRGVARKILKQMERGTVYPPRDGYLLSARGNPLGNVVREREEIIVHTAGGRDLRLKPLKTLVRQGKLSQEAMIAMVYIKGHMDRLECYACHATWAPQCYGCHLRIDYSKGARHPDWVAAGQDHNRQGLTADARGELEKHLIDGQITEMRSYLRWENPPLVVNGEHRVSPAIPGCQTTVTVIGKDGDPLLLNHIFKIPGVEGAGPAGQLAIDISPVQPHTIQKRPRDCQDCHANPVSLGYGLGTGRLYADPGRPYIVDLTSANGEVIPRIYSLQLEAIPGLRHDWSRFVSEEGEQLQTVGHHFKGSRPLNEQERSRLDRRGVCLACHQEIPDQDLAVGLLTHLRVLSGIEVNRGVHNRILHKLLLLGAWGQVLGGCLFFGAVMTGVYLSLKFILKY